MSAQTKMSINLDAFPPYINTLGTVCGDFCASQSSVDRSYNNVQATWQDKNCAVTGQKLMETASSIKRFYALMTDQMERAKTYYIKSWEVIDEQHTPERLPQIGEFIVSIKEPANMSNNTIITDVNALIDFKRNLDNYIETILHNVNSLVSAHKGMGGAWNDAHYYEFGEAIDSFRTNMQEQLNALKIISDFLGRKIQKYEEANRV